MPNDLFDDPAFDSMRAFYGDSLTPLAKKEIITNVCGFFDLLAQWQAEQDSRAISKPEVLPHDIAP